MRTRELTAADNDRNVLPIDTVDRFFFHLGTPLLDESVLAEQPDLGNTRSWRAPRRRSAFRITWCYAGVCAVHCRQTQPV